MLEMRDSNYPHIKFIDLDNDGVMKECALMHVFDNGDIAYIPITSLDAIDRNRLLKIVTSDHATMFELHELMKNHTLKNGMNALEYFHQLVEKRTATGQKIGAAQRGIGSNVAHQNVNVQQKQEVSGKKKKVLLEVPPTSE